MPNEVTGRQKRGKTKLTKRELQEWRERGGGECGHG